VEQETFHTQLSKFYDALSAKSNVIKDIAGIYRACRDSTQVVLLERAGPRVIRALASNIHLIAVCAFAPLRRSRQNPPSSDLAVCHRR
jgi:hypothetical protein